MTYRFGLHPDWRRLAAVCGLAAAALPSRALAEEPLRLEWESPAECPQQAAVRDALRGVVGEDVWRRRTELAARGRIERNGDRYRLTLSVREGESVKERKIESDSCDDLGGAAAVTLGLLMKRGRNPSDTSADARTKSSASPADSDGAGDATDAAGDATDATRAAAEAKGRSSTESSRQGASDREPLAGATARGRRVRWVLRVPVASLELARLPHPSFGFGGGVGVRYAAWQFVAVGRYLLPQTLWAEQFPDIGTRVSRFAVELWSCHGWRNGAFEVAPCVTVGVEHLTARGVGPPNVTPSSQRSTSALLGGAAALHYHFSDFSAVFLGGGMGVATARPSLSMNGLGEIGHVGPVQVSVGIGSEWIF